MLSIPSLVSAETGKELITDTCYNELHQLEHKTLWSSRIQRLADGHSYVEKEIETVDGPVRRLISVDGHDPSPHERKQDDEKLRDLARNLRSPRALKKNDDGDRKKLADLLRAVPDAFFFEDQGNQGDLEKLSFRPNPAYNPRTYEETALHAMSGVVLINVQEKRLAQLSATLMQQTDIGYGLIGRLNKGGTVDITRIRISPGVWKTRASKISVTGRLIIFKTIDKQKDEIRSDFERVLPGTSMVQALQQLSER